MAVKKTATTAETTAEAENEPRYTKYRILKSKTYAANKWFLEAVLDDDKAYTKAEIDKFIENGGAE